MNKWLDQTLFGLWCAMGVGLGILSRSWVMFGSFMLVACFLASGTWAARSMKSENVAVRRGATTVAIIYIMLVCFGFLMTIERIYLVNGSSYPGWLVRKDVGNFNDDGVGNIHQISDFSKAYCPSGGMEVFGKDNGLYVMRCGGMLWYEANTYTAHFKDAK
ncbi:hypothetical protein ACO0LB_17770 [Undibacterium sp. SXout7W]|uniref:hypothetical protein n=1 Tax=Undibacterium sp. SXout7W TaxID=3413049 RepID=UPI003BEF7A53